MIDYLVELKERFADRTISFHYDFNFDGVEINVKGHLVYGFDSLIDFSYFGNACDYKTNIKTVKNRLEDLYTKYEEYYIE